MSKPTAPHQQPITVIVGKTTVHIDKGDLELANPMLISNRMYEIGMVLTKAESLHLRRKDDEGDAFDKAFIREKEAGKSDKNATCLAKLDDKYLKCRKVTMEAKQTVELLTCYLKLLEASRKRAWKELLK